MNKLTGVPVLTLSRRGFLMSVSLMSSSLLSPIIAVGQEIADDFTMSETEDGFVIDAPVDSSLAEVVFSERGFTVWSNGEPVISANHSLSTIQTDVDAAVAATGNHDATTASVPSGYVFLTQRRYGNITTWAVLVATLIAIGLSAGRAGAIASAVFAAIGAENPVYLEIRYYHNKTKELYYQVIRAYRNSNYTGQIYYSEYGPYSSTSPLVVEEDY